MCLGTMTTALASPSAEAYEELLSSLPEVGEPVYDIPSYANAIPNARAPMVITGSYEGLKFTARVEGGRTSYLVITPEAGSVDTSDIEEDVLDAIESVYGEHAAHSGSNYVWNGNRSVDGYSAGNYSVSSGKIFFQF